MADIVADGKIKVYWLTSCANINAPTTTELNAGMDLTSTLTADGFAGWAPDTAAVDTSSLASTFNTSVNGRTSFSNTKLQLKRQSGTDTIFTTLVRDTAGFVVVRRSMAQSTAWASTQAVEVYPALIGEIARVDPEPNSVERYGLPVMITSSPALRAAVA